MFNKQISKVYFFPVIFILIFNCTTQNKSNIPVVEINKEKNVSHIVSDDEINVPNNIFSYYPKNEEENIPIDADIHISALEPFELQNVVNNFSIKPDVAKEIYLRWFTDENNQLTIELSDLLPNQEYIIEFKSNLKIGNFEIDNDWTYTFRTGEIRRYQEPGNLTRPNIINTNHNPNSSEYYIKWNNIENADNYEIQESISEFFEYVDRDWTLNNTEIKIIVEQSNEYYYRIRAINSNEVSEWSRIFFIKPINTTPDNNTNDNFSNQELQRRRDYYHQFFQLRYSEDLTSFTQLQLNNIENQYQIANNNWNTQIAIDALLELVNIPEYTGANRIGCALLYLAQLIDLNEKETYLIRSIEEYSNSWYGDGVNVGAYATYQLFIYYTYINDISNAEKYKSEIMDKYLDYIDHRQNYLSDLILTSD